MSSPVRIVHSLTNRIFLACTLLVTLALALAFGFLYWRTSQDAEASLARALADSSVLVQEHQASLSETSARMSRLLADLPKLKAAVETGDGPTVQPLADDYRQQIAADVLILSGRTGARLASSGVMVAELPSDATEPALQEHSLFLLLDEGLLDVTSVPILLDGEPPDILGRLTVGFLFDHARAQQFKRLTGSEVAVLANGRVIASSIDLDGGSVFTSPLHTDGPFRLVLNGEEFAAISHAMATRPAGTTTPVLTPAAVVLQSRTERLRLLSTIRSGLLGSLLVAVLLATILSYGVARTMTGPLSAVTTVMRDMAATGDLGRKVTLSPGAWHDDDARLLATTFNTLTESIATFQREAAQRDRLSALGRLSTIIAHEIRNPLMIIKASLRSLRKDAVDPAERREAIADIDTETTRLNRIVSDVLDFARPIQFERHEVDLNSLCQTSVAAAWVDASTSQVALDLTPGMPPLITDGERLRTALVNILTNARHAVAAVHRAPVSAAAVLDAEVSVSTRTAGVDLQVIICDRGVGISADDLAHIFDPYFTTRQTGTGLGLPIAKNIIEGLGGRIEVVSAPGQGTEIRITLPCGSEAV
jgi:signal transduction histidine kinase